MTWWPQPRHLTLKSAPVRITSHSLLPHGCGLRNSTISPRRYLSAIYITIPERLRFYRKLLFLRSASVVLEICGYLPLADRRLVPLAFLHLCLDVLVGYMVPEEFPRKFALPHLTDGLFKAARQHPDVPGAPVLLAHVEQVPVDRFRRLDFVLYAVKAGREDGSQCQVRVAARIGAPEFKPRRRPAGCRHPDQRAPVPGRPRDIDRSFISRYKPLV